MESTQILLRYFVNAASERRKMEREVHARARASNVRPRKILCPSVRKRAMKSFYALRVLRCHSPDSQNFTYAPSSPRYYEFASNNAKRHVMEYRDI